MKKILILLMVLTVGTMWGYTNVVTNKTPFRAHVTANIIGPDHHSDLGPGEGETYGTGALLMRGWKIDVYDPYNPAQKIHHEFTGIYGPKGHNIAIGVEPTLMGKDLRRIKAYTLYYDENGKPVEFGQINVY